MNKKGKYWISMKKISKLSVQENISNAKSKMVISNNLEITLKDDTLIKKIRNSTKYKLEL